VERELTIPCDGAELPATITSPEGATRGALVALHPASDGSRSQPHFSHLAAVLAPLGIAVLRYDRRVLPADGEVPFDQQLDDLGAAVSVVRDECGDVPLGVWGYSQGAWIAVTAAAELEVAGLVLVSFSAVSPAAQMQFGVAEHARRAGLGAESLAQIRDLRGAWEAFQRGHLDRDDLQARIDRAAVEPWFEHSWVPDTAPCGPTWADMDFDPAPYVTRLTCPTLAIYGSDDEWVPVQACLERWGHGMRPAGPIELCVLDGVGHDLGIEGWPSAQSTHYDETLCAWVKGHLLG
jgi:hypothetical protein